MTLSFVGCLGCMFTVFFCAAFVELNVTSANHTRRVQDKQTCSEQLENTPSDVSLVTLPFEFLCAKEPLGGPNFSG